VGYLQVEIPLISVLPFSLCSFRRLLVSLFGANTFRITIQLSRLVAASQSVIALWNSTCFVLPNCFARCLYEPSPIRRHLPKRLEGFLPTPRYGLHYDASGSHIWWTQNHARVWSYRCSDCL